MLKLLRYIPKPKLGQHIFPKPLYPFNFARVILLSSRQFHVQVHQTIHLRSVRQASPAKRVTCNSGAATPGVPRGGPKGTFIIITAQTVSPPSPYTRVPGPLIVKHSKRNPHHRPVAPIICSPPPTHVLNS